MAPPPSDRLSLRLDRALARLGVTALIPVLLLLLAWGQELVDQLFFAGQWNLPMLPGGPFLGVLTGWIPPVVATPGWKRSIRACRYRFSQLHHF